MDTDPYVTPRTEFSDTKLTVKNAFWWLYFSLLLLMFIATIITFFLSGTLNFISIISSLLDVLCIVGLFGYIRSYKILIREFWILVFILEVLKLSLVTSLFTYNYFSSTYDTNERLVALVGSVSFIVALPLCYSLWRYSFKSNEIWLCNATQQENK